VVEMNIKILTRLALLSAFGLILQMFAFPLPFFPEYLKYDAAELPALIAAFAIAPGQEYWLTLAKTFCLCLLAMLLLD